MSRVYPYAATKVMNTPLPGPVPSNTPRRERLALGVLLLLYLISAGGFALATPYGEAPDEFAHLLYVEHLARYGTLPQIHKDPYTYEAVQPPLYYLMGATVVLVGRGISNDRPRNAPLAPLVQSNPAYQEPRTSDMVVLHPPDQRWLVWPLVLRGFSILLGLGLIVLTYLTARVLVPLPAPGTVPLIATAFAALIPQANFIRASVSNENLADLIASLILFLLVLHLARPYRRSRVLWLGVVYGLALLTKLTLAPLLALIVPVLWLRRPRGEMPRFARDLGLAAVPVVLLVSPYLLYNWQTYGDPLALAASNVMLGKAKLDLEGVLSETFRWQVWSSFWGVYGWQNVNMPDEVYFALAILTGLGMAGGLVLLVRRRLTALQQAGCALLVASVLLMYAILQVVSLREIIWQGREMYPVLPSVCILFGFGLVGLLDLFTKRRAARPGESKATAPPAGEFTAMPEVGVAIWRRGLEQALLPVVALAFFALNLYSIFWLVVPALNPPAP